MHISSEQAASNFDLLIAASALEFDESVLMLNTRRFDLVPDLRILTLPAVRRET